MNHRTPAEDFRAKLAALSREQLEQAMHYLRARCAVTDPGAVDRALEIVSVSADDVQPHCGARWPNLGPAGDMWTCTLDAGHDGDHEARGTGGRHLFDRSSVIPQGHSAVTE